MIIQVKHIIGEEEYFEDRVNAFLKQIEESDNMDFSNSDIKYSSQILTNENRLIIIYSAFIEYHTWKNEDEDEDDDNEDEEDHF